ncbi:MAG: hypothetical protein HETSPECPRED_001363 [Heterodermia speciosa]|uniref:ATPase inhibitor, mitochondrial n=1 Tax=Heterodermia speciosa TaxID=116794 RepID=A0A8H3I342_9LECA|nr:MAG: hypothetical protein HETSPECPRED_001363 [Heterodermia speciosa]
MIRQTLVQAIKPALRAPLLTCRTLSTSSTRLAEGDTGAPKSGGSAQGDAFSKREQADENLYMRQKEQEKLQALKEKIKEHKKHLEELEKNVEIQGSKAGKGAQK